MIVIAVFYDLQERWSALQHLDFCLSLAMIPMISITKICAHCTSTERLVMNIYLLHQVQV